MRWRLLFLGISIISCTGDYDGSTRSEGYWINNTSHTIEIRPFFSGTTPQNLIVVLQPGEKKQIANDLNIGKYSTEIGFGSDYLVGTDSLHVTFDNQYSISHYLNRPTIFAIKYYLWESTRNLNNRLSYEVKVLKETVTSGHYQYTYYFTEQDYLDAK